MGQLTKFVADVLIRRNVALHRIPLDALSLAVALGVLKLVARARRQQNQRHAYAALPMPIEQEVAR